MMIRKLGLVLLLFPLSASCVSGGGKGVSCESACENGVEIAKECEGLDVSDEGDYLRSCIEECESRQAAAEARDCESEFDALVDCVTEVAVECSSLRACDTEVARFEGCLGDTGY
ncbi:MAG TPA: hypothetical protein DFR83_05745 [Deltaproteobacteria bacterium]|nr:hypothetical protein [Deltaproteobacteria bacterium]